MIHTNDGVALNVVSEGPDDARVVVLIAGYGASANSWKLQRDFLSKTHRVVTIDRRNHGESDEPSWGQRLARHAKDVAEVLDALELSDVLLVGSSMGASTSLAYIELFGTSRLRGVMLVDQTPKMINEGDWSYGFYDLTRENLSAFIDDFPGTLNPFHVIPSPEVLSILAGGREFSIDATRGLLRDHAEKDWRDVLPRIDIPVYAVAGGQSPLWPCESSEWMASAAPLGEYILLDGVGHAPMVENPALFNAALLKAANA